MPPARGKAAIPADELLDRPLGELSAFEFLQVLHHPIVGKSHIRLIADKKKYELWVDEGPVLKINVREVIVRLKTEKKKAELELDDRVGPVVNPPWEREQLVEEIAALVERRLGRG